MKKQNDSKLIWLISRRVLVYSLFGVFSGAVWGALCAGLAGLITGASVTMFSDGLNSVIFVDYENSLTGSKTSLLDIDNIGVLGMVGSYLGAVVGGIIGLLSFGILGIVAPPSRVTRPPRSLVSSMIKAMAIATAMGVVFYFMWCLILGLLIYGFADAIQSGFFYAMFGVPILMGLGQIAGVWRAARKLGKIENFPAQLES